MIIKNEYVNGMRGFGDSIDKLFQKTGVKKIVKKVTGDKDCSPCAKRREKLNELFPYKKRNNNE
jgi:hypothetical protein